MKCLGAFAMPLCWVWSSLLLAVFALYLRQRFAWMWVLSALFVLFTLVTNRHVASYAMRALEGEVSDPFAARPWQALIVLGGGTGSTHDGRAQLSRSGDRVMLAARLYHRGLTPRLVLSGSPMPGVTEHDSARASARIFRDLHIPNQAIVRLAGAKTTSEEARLHAREIKRRGWTRVGLLSSAWHLPRAMARFREQGVRVEPVAADVRGQPEPWRGLLSVLPSAAAALDLKLAAWEFVGRAVGR